jgi:hypothetical protein
MFNNTKNITLKTYNITNYVMLYNLNSLNSLVYTFYKKTKLN